MCKCVFFIVHGCVHMSVIRIVQNGVLIPIPVTFQDTMLVYYANGEQRIPRVTGYSPLCFEICVQNGKTLVIKKDTVQIQTHCKNKRKQNSQGYNTLQKHKVGMHTKGIQARTDSSATMGTDRWIQKTLTRQGKWRWGETGWLINNF